MINSPNVSVVVPCYNQGVFLEETVNSVRNQSFQNFEIIIVNDGSTDVFTNDLLSTYAPEKTKVYRIENRGASGARNFGITKARGQYIFPLDADDKIHKLFLEKTVDYLERHRECGFVTTWVQFFGEESGVWETSELLLSHAFLANTTCGNSLFRKECWEKVGCTDEQLLGYEDWNFWIAISRCGYKNGVIKEPLFYYRKRKGTKVSEDDRNREVILRRMIENHREVFDENAETLFLALDKELQQYKRTLETIHKSTSWRICQQLLRLKSFPYLIKRALFR